MYLAHLFLSTKKSLRPPKNLTSIISVEPSYIKALQTPLIMAL